MSGFSSRAAKTLQGPAGWALVVLVGGVVAWVLFKKLGQAAGAVAKGTAGLVTGDNVITENQHNWDGSTQDAYQGKGVFGTLGAAANSVTGGGLSSIGEWLGGKIFDWTHSSDTQTPDPDAKNFSEVQLNGW